MEKLQQLKDILKKHGLRVTQSRLAVATILIKNSDRPLTSEEIFTRVQKTKNLSCDQVSVYRILSAFQDLGLIRKSSFQGDASRYILADDLEGSAHKHEHFFKCVSCNKIEPFTGCLVANKERELEKKGYTNLRHHLEIIGLCPDCAHS